MELINSGMRMLIKKGAVIAQTAQFVSLMPKPQDFVTRIVGDVVYLSAQVNKLSDEMNKLLDSYAEIPGNYLMTQMNSITGSLTGITNRVSTYAQNGVDQVLGLGENMAQTISELTGTVIDTAGSAVNAVVGLGSAVAESTEIIGSKDTAEEIHDGTEVILEWTSGGFKNTSDSITNTLNGVTEKIKSVSGKATGAINDATDTVNKNIEEAQNFVFNIINKLRESMKKLESTLDGGFKDVTGMSSIAKEADKVSQALKESGNTSKEAVAVDAISSNLSAAIKNFSIGKAVSAFVGVLTQSVIVRFGLNELPPIDFESMLCRIRDDMEMSTEDLYEQYNKINKELDDNYNDFIQFGDDAAKIPSEDRDYDTKNYKDFIKSYEGELKEQREKIRNLMKYNKDTEGSNDALAKRELRSAIKEVQKYRKQVKNAKQSETLKGIIGDELDNLKKEAEYRCNSLKSDWKSMMDQYNNAIQEIREFFTSGGSCDMFIDDCCDQINKDCDDIKDLCKNLIMQLTSSIVKVAMPADIGSVVPNPAYKVADFLMDIKTILKFIKDIITLIIDIINNINKIARLFINGVMNLKEIIDQLMKILGLKWLMDLVQSIIELFGGNILEAKVKLENTLAPVHFGDTDEYMHTLEALEDMLDGGKKTDRHVNTLGDLNTLLKTMLTGKKKEDDTINELMSKVDGVKNMSSVKEDSVDDLIDELEKFEDYIVAYKSPMIDRTGSTPTVSDSINNGEKVDVDIKFKGWHYFHPNLYHTNTTYYGTGLIDSLLKKIKSKIVKKASKNSHKSTGGVYKLHHKIVGKASTRKDEAYVAFYWYTYYTDDLEKECFDKSINEGAMIIDSVISTQNGSVVEITDAEGNKRKVFVADNMVKSGDYVNVDGVRYRVN